MTIAEKRMEFMKYVKDKYHPLITSYPACGADYSPIIVFGSTRVIHLSHPDNEPDTRYLERLGDGIKLLGDMNNSPLADKSVDLIWLNMRGLPLNKKILSDFKRVLKNGGLIAVEEDQFVDIWRNKWQKRLDEFRDLKEIKLPKDIRESETVYVFVEADDPDGAYKATVVKNEEEMIQNVVGKGGKYVGRQHVMDRALFQI